MFKVKVRMINGDYRTMAKSRSFGYVKRIARIEASKELETFLGDFELFEGSRIIRHGSIINSRIKWRKIK